MDEAGRGCPSRASLPTVARSEQPDGDFLQDFEHALDEPKLTWAVDCEGELSALSTFDLWYALNVGSLSRSARVWRVGREAWTPVLEVPELACALRADDAPPVERTTMDYAVKPPAFELASEEPSVPAESPQPSPDVSDDLPPALRRPSAPPGRSSAPPPESRVTRVSVEAVTMPPRSLPPAKPARRRSAWSAMAAGLAFVFGFSAAAMAASAVETPAAPLGSMALLSSIESPGPPRRGRSRRAARGGRAPSCGRSGRARGHRRGRGPRGSRRGAQRRRGRRAVRAPAPAGQGEAQQVQAPSEEDLVTHQAGPEAPASDRALRRRPMAEAAKTG